MSPCEGGKLWCSSHVLFWSSLKIILLLQPNYVKLLWPWWTGRMSSLSRTRELSPFFFLLPPFPLFTLTLFKWTVTISCVYASCIHIYNCLFMWNVIRVAVKGCIKYEQCTQTGLLQVYHILPLFVCVSYCEMNICSACVCARVCMFMASGPSAVCWMERWNTQLGCGSRLTR